MSTDRSINQQVTKNTKELTSERFWFFGVLNMLLLLVIMFFAEVSSLQADGLFDFQMKLAKKGNPEAQFKVGEMYETGFGVKKDMKEATSWINKAAAQGHETAGFKLLYWDMQKNGLKGGNRVKFDDVVRKAEGGNGQAMYYVGKSYAHGVGVKKNYDKALDWLNKATFVGITAAESEAVAVREDKQRSLAAERREEAKRKAAAEAAAAAAAAAKKREAIRKKKEQAARAKAERERRAAVEAAANAATADAQRDAEAKKRRAQQAAAAAAEKERRRQALMKQREQEEAARKAAFESDPCSGKSARFLSTCR